MTFKSKAQSLLKSFFSWVKTQFCCVVKAIRTNNGSEFISMRYFFFIPMAPFFNILALTHLNKVVERKHRHLLNVAHAIRFMATRQLVILLIVYLHPCCLTCQYMKFYMESHPLIHTFDFLDAYVMQLTSHPCTNLTCVHVNAFLLVILLGRKVIMYMTLILREYPYLGMLFSMSLYFLFSISQLEDQSNHPVLPMQIDEVMIATPSTLVDSLDSLSSS